MKKNFTQPVFAFVFALLFSFSALAQSGSALSYTTDDYTTLPDGIVSSLTGSYTIEAWVYWRGGDQWQRIFDFGNSTSEYIYLAASGDIISGNALMTLGIKTSAGPSEQRAQGGVLPVNTWTHVAVTVDNATNNGRIYINGVISASTNSMTYRPADLGTTTQNWLGHSQYSGSPFFDPDFNGVIDEFRISNTLRYTGNFTPAQTFTDDANTVALYHFDEGVGQVSADATANNGDAILGATAAVETTDPSWI
ncbi:MAG TPA: LamG domain-containing protein, partial [Flavisolibacter sp.]|nr:LamG domain-containing protein [Flavisolibacter sp.]